MRDVIDLMQVQGHWPPASPKTKGRDVLAEVAEKHGISVAALISQSTMKRFYIPRQDAYFSIKSLCPHLTWAQIGQLVGGRDHSSVMHGAAKHAARHGLQMP